MCFPECGDGQEADACKLSGMMPLHAVVTCSLQPMYEFLAFELPRKWRVSPDQITLIGKQTSTDSISLSPLQLAAALGDHGFVQHILKHQCEVMWEWGPVTQFALDLTGIDSAGIGGGDIMELIVRTSAKRRTVELLLDSFMNGFIWKLFQEKWVKFGRKIHYVRILIDLLLLLSLAYQTACLKMLADFPDAIRRARPLSILNLCLIGLCVGIEGRSTLIAVRNNVALARTRSSGLTAVRNSVLLARKHLHDNGDNDTVSTGEITIGTQARIAVNFIVQHRMQVHLTGYVFATAGCAILLAEGDSPSADEQLSSVLWIMQAFALLLLTQCFFSALFQPYESLSILMRTIGKMIRGDVFTFLTIFAANFLAYFLALFTLYPRSGTGELPYVPAFNSLRASLYYMLNLSILGESLELPLFDETVFLGNLDNAQIACLFLWTCLYIVWIILSVILMINLLIAMLTNTFDDVFEEATLNARHGFAVAVMKLEVIADSFGMDTKVGTPYKAARHAYIFHAVRRNEAVKDRGDLGDANANPFDPPPVSDTTKLSSMISARLDELEGKLLTRLQTQQKGSTANLERSGDISSTSSSGPGGPVPTWSAEA